MTDDWFQDPTVKVWARHVLSDMVPKLEDSAVSVSLVPDDAGDVKFWVELGASIMMDKPLIVVVMGDRPLPSRLERVADEVVRLPEGVGGPGSKDLVDAINRTIRRLGL